VFDIISLLPWEWTGDLSDHQVAVSTAHATWWLLLPTAAGAVASTLVVIVALDQERRRSEGVDKELTRKNSAALQAVFNAYAVCREINKSVKSMSQADEVRAWDYYGISEAHRRTLEHYLSTKLMHDNIVYQCNAAIQRMHEVNAALDLLVQKSPDLVQSQSNMDKVVRRIDRDEPDARRIKCEVINGIPQVVSSSTGAINSYANIDGRSASGE